MDYTIITERLGLRNWKDTDLQPFYQCSSDPEVMHFFPKKLTLDETSEFIERMKTHFNEYGYCYFAVDELKTGKFIGMIGLLNQTFESKFTPSVDIGWRLKRASWGQGFASEGAEACLSNAFTQFELHKIYSYAPKINLASISIMKKIGMEYIGEFDHPKLVNDERLRRCAIYEKSCL